MIHALMHFATLPGYWAWLAAHRFTLPRGCWAGHTTASLRQAVTLLRNCQH